MTIKDYITILKELRLKKVKVFTEKVNKLRNILTENIAELNELIYAGAKQVCDEIIILLRNTNRNTKPG